MSRLLPVRGWKVRWIWGSTLDEHVFKTKLLKCQRSRVTCRHVFTALWYETECLKQDVFAMIFLAALLREVEEIAIMDSNITFSGFSITVMFSRVSQFKQKEMWTWTMADIPPCILPSLLLPSHPAWYIAHVIGLREPGEGHAALDNSRQTRHLRLPLCQRGSKPYLFSICLFKLRQLLCHTALKPYLFCVFKQGLIDWDETESALTGVGASSLEQGRKLSPHNTVMDYLSFIWTPLFFVMQCNEAKIRNTSETYYNI